MEKVAFIVPGFKLSASLERYQKIGESFKQNGVQVEYIDLDWETVLDRNIQKTQKEMRKRLRKYEEPEIYFFGHSWGAVCCLAVSTKFNPEAQFLAGLYPNLERK